MNYTIINCRIYFLLISLSLAGLCSCKKDLGNYSYTDINQVSFANIDTVNGYTVFLGDTLKISPKLTGSLDPGGSGSYSYEWKVRNNLFGTNAPDFIETVLATKRDLRYVMNFPPGAYGLTLSVKDNATGVAYLQAVRIEVITQYYQGWLVLNDVKDTSRLDFLSFADNKFTLHENLLAKLNPQMPTQGKPSQVLFASGPFYNEAAGIYLLSASGTTILNPENFEYSEDRNIRNLIFGDVPANFKAEKMFLGRTTTAAYDNLMMYQGGNIYKQSFGSYGYGNPLNTDAITGLPFKIAPHFSCSGGFNCRTVVYNQDNKRFYSFQRADLVFFQPATEVSASLNFPAGKEMVYMYDNDVPSTQGVNYSYTILKEPASDKYSLFRFSYNGDQLRAVDYNEEITGTDFKLAEHYAISPDMGYLFYTVAGKLYEYDQFLKTSKLMLDIGAKRFSLLTFDSNQKPIDWKNSLLVGTYDPAGAEGKNGTLTQYSVPPVNASLVQQYQWTGLGKVISVSYRYR